jgi:membrane associated rhomboid family serine protease
MVGFPDVEVLHQVGALVAVAASLALVWWLDRPGGRWSGRLRSRFVLGVPWGSLLVLASVVLFYLFPQQGWNHWFDPLTLPYRAWSLFYPLGWLTAAFAHSGSGHLISNVTSALVVFPLAEYAYGHFPRRRGSQSFGSLRTNPLARAFVVVPAATVLVGLATALFSWGAIIGFSGVVFAGVGFAAVRYPLGTVVALAAQRGVVLAYRVLLDPIVVREASERFVTPPWAGIAVQGHALGLFVGAALGILVCYREDLLALSVLGSRGEDRPSALRVWFGTLLVGLSLGLWAVWWYEGASSFVLYRGAGLALVALVAIGFAAAIASADRPYVGEDGLTSRQVAVMLLLVPLAVMAIVAVPLNALAVAEATPPADAQPMAVRDYAVFYAEDVPNELTRVVNVSLFGETTQLNTSGVIVVSERREIWSTVVRKGKLASRGRATVVLGGPTWRETVFVKREGWSAVGGPSTYRVRMGPERGTTDVVFTAEPATADPVLAGRNLSVVPDDGRFLVRVSRNGTTLGTAPLPRDNETVDAGGITFVRDGTAVVARVDGTRVKVFSKECD